MFALRADTTGVLPADWQAMTDYLREELRFVRRGAGLRDRGRILSMILHEYLRFGAGKRIGQLLPLRSREFDLRLDRGGPFLRLRSDDLSLFEIYARGSCDVDLAVLGAARSVLDLGANVGLATVFLAARLPEARFACVEASPKTFALLAENLRRNVPEATSIRAAAVGEPGQFHVEQGPRPGLHRVAPGRGADGTEIEGMTVPQLLDRAGLEYVDLMKIDIEGGEVGLLEHAAEWAPRVGAVLLEVHAPTTVADAERTLSGHGYSILPLPDRPIFSWRETVYAARSPLA
jgi:FkbM family methyltransferase